MAPITTLMMLCLTYIPQLKDCSTNAVKLVPLLDLYRLVVCIGPISLHRLAV